jgi:hypothetical protein
LGSIILALCCSSPEKTEVLGHIIFKAVVGTANRLFIKGHLLMHSFEYDDVAEFFTAHKGSSCVMAFWGEALTYNHPIWQSKTTKRGKALENWGPITQENEKTSSELREISKAADILYGVERKRTRQSIC